MAKLGWVLFALLGISVVGMGAARVVPLDDNSAKLDEIKSLLTEQNRLQRIDVHARLRKGHPLFKSCDFGERCDSFDTWMPIHHMKTLGKTHDFTEECITAEGCKRADAKQAELRQKK